MHQRKVGGGNEEDKDYIEVTNDRGILKKIIKEGNGENIPIGVTAIVHYTGKLITGEIFDSSRTRGTPFEFNIGQREVILGWDQGITSMKKGEVSILKITPEYGYGSRAIGPIPSNSTLLFEVELIDWKKSEDSLFKKLLAVAVLAGFAIYILYMRFTKHRD
mmetsp:Transcript_11605/g.11988  ORF Transcript_11605/g.11988 Transcript_11605/m.11988 type:complete len:162 (+) Transcript_11605:54-539(+)|eukprot:CAMPEP_0174819092 /NCGR_PEP_ID=MMETSP1107-20130205/2109_1 /TAXON_ID=36770 /ORGANISM="Paraphysomonas vestita, Strain GFlagA" /LENGTH=161 /DNA_ID=CAMNT_0016031933 /DNA_START=36 /DNA_END=521 /DNA_ORIENTATION=-